jgi:protein SCO1/2
MILRRLMALVVAGVSFAALGESSSTPPQLPGPVSIDQKIGAKIPMELMFRDERGQIVRFGQLFRGKPVLFNFMYYRCPMLCSLVEEGETNALTELKFDVGKEFDVITVSIDPRDMPEAAAAKKEMYLKRYGRFSASAGWHFLTGHESAIKSLANAVGFHYAYDPKLDQFAHGAALMVLTADGHVSRYLYGFDFRARDLKLALMEASSNKLGTLTDQILLLCYHYEPATGKYSRNAMNFVRVGGIATMAGLAGFIFIMIRRERHGEGQS